MLIVGSITCIWLSPSVVYSGEDRRPLQCRPPPTSCQSMPSLLNKPSHHLFQHLFPTHPGHPRPHQQAHSMKGKTKMVAPRHALQSPRIHQLSVRSSHHHYYGRPPDNNVYTTTPLRHRPHLHHRIGGPPPSLTARG
ncbi:hypothetical protein B0J12DRAFT_308973 [Macrophomina phaseolina]|uniref:Secreted protein n=1 Tax=Macrophomina phaseolina TaxID=35725 RepID=A0ABQ8FZT7_9PEZI|nr:hypothetical protein B0J12DRAFT_308973 [Macrophomina phaseolina]